MATREYDYHFANRDHAEKFRAALDAAGLRARGPALSAANTVTTTAHVNDLAKKLGWRGKDERNPAVLKEIRRLAEVRRERRGFYGTRTRKQMSEYQRTR